MLPLSDPYISALLTTLLARMQHVLGARLVGLYLYGSLVSGDFDPATSDLDLLAALSADLDDPDVEQLRAMHAAFAEQHPAWRDRIEVHYLSLAALRTFKTEPHMMAVISPGEPLHVIDIEPTRLVNWYVVQEKGVTLFGPAPGTLIDPISRAEFVEAVRAQMREWRTWIYEIPRRRPSQAYAILTMCRGLYTCMYGEQISKQQAARWMQRYAPEWAPLISDALRWRANWRAEQGDDEATFGETLRFVQLVIDRVEEL